MRRWTSRLAPYAITLLVSLSLLVPAAYVGAPHVRRWQMLSQLTSRDAQRREAALGYVAALAGRDDRVLRGAAARLGDAADDANFLQIVGALQQAGAWRAERIGTGAWLRWLSLLSRGSDAESGIFVAQHLADLPALAADARLTGLLGPLLEHVDAEVRINALMAAGELAGAPGGARSMQPLIAGRTRDAEPLVARHAWILLGLMGDVSDATPDWRTASPQVAEAMLWAVVRGNPVAPGAAVEALRDVSAPPLVRASAAYALSLSDTEEAREALIWAASPELPVVAEENQLVIWRAVLALPRPDLKLRPPGRLEEAVGMWAADEGANPLVEPIALAAISRLGMAVSRRVSADPAMYDQLMKLATVEGQEPPYMRWRLEGYKSPLLRAQTLAVSLLPPTFNPEDWVAPVNAIMPVLESPDATLRDLGVKAAAKMFDQQRIDYLCRELLSDFNNQRRMSGAILAGLTGTHVEAVVHGRRVDLLAYLAEREQEWEVRQVLRLGLWMQGRLPEMDAQVARLLLREDVPKSTILLAMLHRERLGEALDWLLNPRGGIRMDLLELFDNRRWWFVLRDYLPADSPPFWVWADPGLEQFQVDVLRDWWLMARSGRGTATRDAASE